MDENENKEYNAEKLHKELMDAGLTIHGVDCAGNISWAAEPPAEALALAEQVKAAHTPLSPAEAQWQAYLSKGVTLEAMVHALWERVVMDNPVPAQEIIARLSDTEN